GDHSGSARGRPGVPHDHDDFQLDLYDEHHDEHAAHDVELDVQLHLDPADDVDLELDVEFDLAHDLDLDLDVDIDDARSVEAAHAHTHVTLSVPRWGLRACGAVSRTWPSRVAAVREPAQLEGRLADGELEDVATTAPSLVPIRGRPLREVCALVAEHLLVG